MHQLKVLSILFITVSMGLGEPIITSTLSLEDGLCPGKVLILTCETRGSPTIEWISHQYIDAGGSALDFIAASDRIGATKPSHINPNDTATFVNNTGEGETQILVSQLNITISAEFPVASISCMGRGTTTIPIQTLGAPEIQNVTANQKSDNTGGCLVVITWSLPSNVAEKDISQYLVYVNGTKLDEPIYMPPAAYRMCSCGSYDISVSAVNRCGLTGQNSSFITVDNSTTLLSRDCGILTTQPTCPENTCTPNDASWRIAVAAVIPIIMLIIATTVLAYLLLRECRRRNNQLQIERRRHD